MTCSTYPFTPERHGVGTLADGRPLTLEPMTPETAAVLAPQIALFGPWAHYEFPVGMLHAGFLPAIDGAIRYQLLAGGVAAGAVIIRSPWLAGPYLQMLAVLPALQRRGAGGHVLDWFEATAAGAKMRNVWLCVSGYNAHAQRLYKRQGYDMAGLLTGLMRDSDDEHLMRKNLAGRLRAES